MRHANPFEFLRRWGQGRKRSGGFEGALSHFPQYYVIDVDKCSVHFYDVLDGADFLKRKASLEKGRVSNGSLVLPHVPIRLQGSRKTAKYPPWFTRSIIDVLKACRGQRTRHKLNKKTRTETPMSQTGANLCANYQTNRSMKHTAAIWRGRKRG